MKVALGADHAGFELKEKIKQFLVEQGHEPADAGAMSFDPGDDYPFFAEKAAEMVADGKADRGIVVCNTGIGVDIVANKVPGVRSALVHNEELAKRTRQHNDTNVLALGAMFLDEDQARGIVQNWLDTDFSGADRHSRRIREIADIERHEIIAHLDEAMDDDGQ